MKRKIKNTFPNQSIDEANREFLARRSKRLRENGAALAFLLSLGIGEEIQKAFHMGLSEPYTDTKGIVHENALIAPIINVHGKPSRSSVYFNIPCTTINPTSDDFWSRGEAQTYYSEAYKWHKSVIICPNLLDLWMLQNLLASKKQNPKVLFITSSDSKYFPKQWKESEFWSNFENIYLADPNNGQGDKTALKAAQIAGNRSKRLRLPASLGSTWREFCQTSENAGKDFVKLLEEASPIEIKISSKSNELAPGRFGYQPVDIAGSFQNGHLYYPVRTVNNVSEKYRDEYGNRVSQTASRIETVLIRSDRSIQHVVEVLAPRGTPPDERLMKLTDGTLIETKPKASIHSTWSWNSIEKFRAGKSRTRSLDIILENVKAFLKKSIWLPFEHDYDLLTLLVPVTFAQAIFQSVPLVLVTGAPGTGKSALGRAMIKICANASTIGQISPASVARLIDETKGFVVFDDLESIGKRKGRDTAKFTELIQALKLSYNKETSWKSLTDMGSGGSVKRLNFYGVKMINNTTGSDSILGSRLLKIHTRKIPGHLQNVLGTTEPSDVIGLNKLREELHTWTFENVNLIDQTYQRLFPASSDRASEISAPLRVFGELSGDGELQNGLVRALEFQTTVSDDSINPVELMKEAVKRLIIDGHKEISPTHVVLEMENLISNKPLAEFDENPKWKNPAWVGRQLRVHGLVEINHLPARQLFFGKSVRVYPVNKNFLDTILPESDVLQKRKASGSKNYRL